MTAIPEGYILFKKVDYDVLIQTIEELKQKVQTLTAKIEELEGQLHQNSQNSQKPPSTDAFKKPIKNSREISNKKQGAQNGHEGNKLKMVGMPDKIIEYKITWKCQCGIDLNEVPLKGLSKSRNLSYLIS